MVCRVNHDTDNSQHRLLTIQQPHDSKWREKRGEEREESKERHTEQEEIEKSEEEQQTRLERQRYAAMNTEQQRNLTGSTKKKEMVGQGSDGLSNRVLAILWGYSLGNTTILTQAKNPTYSNGSPLGLPTHCIKSNVFNYFFLLYIFSTNYSVCNE